MMVRLVKGAYWDTEIKRAQERGLDGYPVFTRKAMTDLNYIACAQQLLALRPRIFPQFATHNALTVATILELADGAERIRIPAPARHGRGALRASSAKTVPRSPVAPMRRSAATATCWPIWCGGCWRTAPTPPSSRSPPTRACRWRTLLQRPADIIGSADNAAHPNIPLPRDLFRPERTNSRGVEFGERAALNQLVAGGRGRSIACDRAASPMRRRTRPMRRSRLRATGFRRWSRTPAATRAAALEQAADLLEQRAAHFIALLQREGGKTLDDALSEVREAVDFCRYYAARRPRSCSATAQPMPGPTGESNMLRLRGRGVFVAISPWNFPLAIFLGQVTAALMAGNAVVAKPAEQTPLIAAEAVRLLHEAGVPDVGAASGARRRPHRRGAGRASRYRRRRLHRLDRGGAIDQPRRSPPRTARSCR